MKAGSQRLSGEPLPVTPARTHTHEHTNTHRHAKKDTHTYTNTATHIDTHCLTHARARAHTHANRGTFVEVRAQHGLAVAREAEEEAAVRISEVCREWHLQARSPPHNEGASRSLPHNEGASRRSAGSGICRRAPSRSVS